MTSSSPSPDRDPIIEAGFAKHENEGGRIPLTGQFVQDMPLGGVFLQDMPTPRPQPRPGPRVKGVAPATTSAGEDYQPGQGTWREVE